VSEPAPPSCSIITVTYGHRRVTERFLESVAQCYGERLGRNTELVIVDNASSDDTRELLGEWEDRATVLLQDTNRNFAGGNNVGARAAQGDVLMLLNNDIELLEPLDELVEEACRPGVGIAGCRLLYPNGTIQHGGCAWASDPQGRVLPFHLFQFQSGDHPAAHATLDCDAVTGACLVVRRALFDELGGFDELYINGLEDMDLCVRARLAGHRVVYRGDVALIHAEGTSRSKRPDDELNQRLFLSRYAAMLSSDAERFAAQFDAVQADVAAGIRAVWRHPGDTPAGTMVSVEGEVTGLAGESAEARALLGGLERAELMPATREWQQVELVPVLSQAEQNLMGLARVRPRRHDALVIQTPIGPLGALDVHPRAILRLAHVPSHDISQAAAVWAAHPALLDRLTQAGIDADRVAVLPPFVTGGVIGAGGEGLLVVLPGHDLRICRQLLAAVAPCLDSVRVRLLPTVATEALAGLVAELSPSAELLAPISGEDRFVALAATCDVVLDVDPGDRFERRALTAAATGTAVVHRPGGIAAWILGDASAFEGSADAVRIALAAGSAAERMARVERIAAACGPETIVPRLRDLIAQAAGRVPERTVAGILRRRAPQTV
jgi:GT2 family glycosyltransferase